MRLANPKLGKLRKKRLRKTRKARKDITADASKLKGVIRNITNNYMPTNWIS